MTSRREFLASAAVASVAIGAGRVPVRFPCDICGAETTSIEVRTISYLTQWDDVQAWAAVPGRKSFRCDECIPEYLPDLFCQNEADAEALARLDQELHRRREPLPQSIVRSHVCYDGVIHVRI